MYAVVPIIVDVITQLLDPFAPAPTLIRPKSPSCDKRASKFYPRFPIQVLKILPLVCDHDPVTHLHSLHLYELMVVEKRYEDARELINREKL